MNTPLVVRFSAFAFLLIFAACEDSRTAQHPYQDSTKDTLPANANELAGDSSLPKPANNLSGSWNWSAADTSEALWLDLVQSGDSITGAYCAFQRGGMRYDCGETGDPVCRVRGTVDGNKASVLFTSCYSGQTGKAELIYDAEKETLTWKVVSGKLQHYAPPEATLKKSG